MRLTHCLPFLLVLLGAQISRADNPIIKDVFTADPAAMVYRGTLYLYTGHDEAKGDELFTMRDWLCFSTRDMKSWTPHGSPLSVKDFEWAVRDAWAGQVIEKRGKFYYYVPVHHDDTHGGFAIGVAISDSPTGPFKDARGSALITDEMTRGRRPWNDIDPTVFTDTDGASYLCWGNGDCYFAKLKPNMTELDGPITSIDLPGYTEAPWLHRRGNLYYLSYAAIPGGKGGEKIAYATASKVTGPWTYRGIITGEALNSFTIHQSIVEFKGQWYFFYHNAVLQLPDGTRGATGRRSVCVERLYYNTDGTIQPIVQTTEGVDLPSNKPGQ